MMRPADVQWSAPLSLLQHFEAQYKCPVIIIIIFLLLLLLPLYLPTQFTFELRVYDISLTWITQHLDAMIDNNVRRWLAPTVSSCVSEILSLSKSKGGFSVTSLKSLTEKLHMTQRQSLRFSKNENMRSLWQVSTVDYRSTQYPQKNRTSRRLSPAWTNHVRTEHNHTHWVYQFKERWSHHWQLVWRSLRYRDGLM